MNIGISTASLYPMLTETALEKLGAAGIMNTEIFINSPSELKKDFIRRLVDTKEKYGINVISVHPYTSVQEPFMIFTEYKRRYADALEAYKLFFNAMNMLGADIFVFHGDRKGSLFEDSLYAERFSGLKYLGEQFGITVAQENVSRCKSGSIKFCRYLKKNIPDISFVFDVKQSVRAGEDPFKMMDAMGENIKHVHLSDNDAEHDCLCVGKGTFDKNKLFKKLKAYSFSGGVLLELYRDNFNELEELWESDKITREIARQEKCL